MFEDVLKRVLQAVFGGGSSIDLDASLDALQSIQLEHRIDRSLNDFFNGRISPVVGVTHKIDLDTYWTSSGLRIPPGHRFLSVYTRAVYLYGHIGIWTKLGPLSIDNFDLIEFETGGGSRGVKAGFLRGAAFEAPRWGGNSATALLADIFLPADYATAEHLYSIKVNRPNVEIYIDENLIGVGLIGLPEPIPVWQNNPPYNLGGCKVTGTNIAVPALIEIDGGGAEYLFPCNPNSNNYIAANGDPLPPRQYALYTENTATKWNGLATNVARTSHPVPVWGYPRKTLVFQANAAGNLAIQVYVGGGWRAWVPGGITLVANQLEVYNLNGEVPIMRAVYTPVGADTITLAECYLGGE